MKITLELDAYDETVSFQGYRIGDKFGVLAYDIKSNLFIDAIYDTKEIKDDKIYIFNVIDVVKIRHIEGVDGGNQYDH